MARSQWGGTFRLDHDLKLQSDVFDVGGYQGQWVSDIFARFLCHIHVFEPISEYAPQIRERLARNKRISFNEFGPAGRNSPLPDLRGQAYSHIIRMMAVQLHGGLGNQLFQLAFGEWLATRHNVIYYSVVPNEKHGPTTRSLQIDAFARLRKRKCLSYPLGHQVARVLCQRHVRRLAGSQLAVLDLTQAADWAAVTAAVAGASGARLALLTGYFQFSYVVDSARIHSDPAFRQVVRSRRPHTEKIGESPDFDADCLLHVRVGDYKQYGFPICGPTYFRGGLEKLAEQGFAGRVFVVSDDPGAAREILGEIRQRMLAVEDPLEVLSLVAAFRYKIISNSTLSLWGALFGDSSACVFPAVWPSNSAEFARIGRAAGWTLAQ